MNIELITGVAGTLGSNLAKELLGKGSIVIGLDNLISGNKSNLEELMENSNFTFIESDVSEKSFLDLYVLEKVNKIYHLASPASPKIYQKFPLETIAVNTIGTKNILELALKNNAKVLFTSTSEVYGDPDVHPQHEGYLGKVNTWGPRACYDESKRLGEVYCYQYFKRFGVDVKVLRLFNTYSESLSFDDGRVISNFISQALTGQDITIYGDGQQTRSFCYIEDTIRAICLAIDNEKATGEIINIGNPEEITILEIATLIGKLTQSKSKVTYHLLPQDDPKIRKPDIKKATELLGWFPVISLEEGLNRTINGYLSKLSLIK